VCDLEDIRSDSKLEIYSCPNNLHQKSEISVLDMSSVFTQMDCDPVHTGKFSEHSCPYGIRFISAPRLPHSSHVVYVQIEAHFSN
jgi:hypothetical protein